MKDPAWMRDKLQALSVEVDELLGSCHMTEDDYRDYLEEVRNAMANGAAVKDMDHAASDGGSFCDICKYRGDECDKRKIAHEECWEWRGVKEESK